MQLLVFTLLVVMATPIACWYCPGKWAIYGDDDPHFVVNYTDPSFTRLVCFDLGGQAEESYTLFHVNQSFDFVGHLVAAKAHSDRKWTYFGSFSFKSADSDVVVSIDNLFVRVKEGANVFSVPWPHKGPYRRIYPEAFEHAPAEIIEGLVITHMMHDYLHLIYGNTSIHIDRHNRKHCNGPKDCSRTPFLGVYLHPTRPMKYEGILGEHVGEKATFVPHFLNPINILRAFADGNAIPTNGVNHIQVNGKLLAVTDHVVLDRMKNERHKCWKVVDNKAFMHHKLAYYRTL